VETGIGQWTKDIFIAKFKSFGTPTANFISADSMHYQTVMQRTM